jgi:iron(III) transport system permease protein
VSFGELSATILVLPPGINTLANQIFGLIHYGVDDQVAGIALAVLAAFMLLGIASLRLTRGSIK